MRFGLPRIAGFFVLALPFSPVAVAQSPEPQGKPATVPQERDAIEEARAALAAAEAEHPENMTNVARTIILLVQRQVVAGKVTQETMELANRAVAVSEAAAGKQSVVYALALAQLAKVYLATDHPEKGRPMAEEALEIAQKVAPGTLEVAQIADALDKLCYGLSDLPCALRTGEQAVAAVRLSRDPDQMYLASMLQDLAQTRLRMGDADGTRAAMEESVAIVERQKKPTRQMTVLESNAGAYFLSTGHLEEALVHLEKALTMSSSVYGPDSIQVAYASANMADTYSRMGRYDEAWKLDDKSLTLHRKWLGARHSRTAYIETTYSASLAAGGNLKLAQDLALEAHQSVRDFITLAIRVLPERQALALSRNGANALSVPLSIAARNPEIGAAEVYQEEIRSRALVADEMAHRQADLNRQNDPEIAALLKELGEERSAMLALRGTVSTGNSTTQTSEETTAHMERIERSLAERSAAFRADERTRAVTLTDVRLHLPADSVLISYVAYQRHVLQSAKLDPTTVPAYLAFVLHPGSDSIKVVNLGDGKPIGDLVQQARAASDAEAHSGGIGSKRNERNFQQASEALKKLIWDPVQTEVGNAKLVLVVPDGALNLIPFSALHDAQGYLVEHGPVIHMLSSERDLIPSDATGPRKAGLLVIGSPTFAVANAGPHREAPVVPASDPARGGETCMDFHTQEFEPLLGSAKEATDIAASWKRWTPDESSEVVTGDQATRDRFLKEAVQFRILHMATHAFLMDSRCGNGNPLLNSGLVFAGTKQNREASILTAQQIASLDLSGVDWAVLSACSTGNGELRDGEGVMGLQRAFRVAGARSVVMTLWPVDDEVTRQFMHDLYTERLGRHASTADAVWNASRTMLVDRRAAGKSTHPWYWAGFVGSGGWE